MSALPAPARAKLAKALALLGSDKPGERDAAGLAAHRIVASAGLTWRQVIEPPAIEKRLPELGTWRATCAALLKQPGSLRKWEIGFVRDLPDFRRLSTKQRYILKEIADRVLGRRDV
jgi:hypothetical protein